MRYLLYIVTKHNDGSEMQVPGPAFRTLAAARKCGFHDWQLTKYYSENTVTKIKKERSRLRHKIQQLTYRVSRLSDALPRSNY